MIVVLETGATKEQTGFLVRQLNNMNLDVQISRTQDVTVLSLSGDLSRIDTDLIGSLESVALVKRVSDPFAQVSRNTHPADTIVQIGNVSIGGGNFALIAGPCSVESEEQITEIAKSVKATGANILRGGAYKPRSSPYTFQGLKEDGLCLLEKAKLATGMPIITEITDVRTLDHFENVDIIQVGARNMQNFDLLLELGKSKKPILLKRGLANTLQELLMSAEYIMSAGNANIILCERGIRTCETYTRNTLDLSAVPVLHELSHLPVIVDPSHATGKATLVHSMALAATACGADGLMIEVHNAPACALCDGAQSITPAQFAELAKAVNRIRSVID